jgi:alpha-1,2-mannosyltransferase
MNEPANSLPPIIEWRRWFRARLLPPIAALRSGSWLNSTRLVVYPFLVLITTVTLAMGALAIGFGQTDRERSASIGADFTSFWAASSLAVDGNPEGAYDLMTLAQREHMAGRHDLVFAFAYPPVYLLLIAPFGYLPFSWSLALWSAFGLAVYLAVAWWMLFDVRAMLLAVSFPGAALALINGQNGLFLAACYGAATITIKDRPLLAGLFLGLLCCKPQIGVLVPIALLAGREWRALAGAFISVLSLTAASIVLFGGAIWLKFLTNGNVFSQSILNGHQPGLMAKMQSFFAVVWHLGFSVNVSLAVQVVLSVLVALLVAVLWLRKTSHNLDMATLVTGSLLATPFVFDYDLATVSVPIAALACAGVQRSPWGTTTLAASWALPLFARSFSVYAGFPPTPFILSALLALTIFSVRTHKSGSVSAAR